MIYIQKFWNVYKSHRLLNEYQLLVFWKGDSQVALVVKNPPTNAGDIRDVASIPG